MSQKKIAIDNWKIVKTSTDYQNRIFSINKHEVILPDGRTSDYYVMDKRAPFAIVIPVTNRNTFYMVGQYRVSMQQVSWEFPMGSVRDKKPLEIAKQELKEETGFTAGTFTELGKFFAAPGHTNSFAYVFLAQGLTPGVPTPEENEFFEMKEVEQFELEDMIKKNTILDGPTIAAYYFYRFQITT